jgi:hypothetical protein
MSAYSNRIAASILVAASCVLSACTHAQTAQTKPEPQFQPQVGQAGKDVIWVPTPEGLVDRMLRMAKVTPNDFVIDLGSGDGRIAIAAGKDFNTRAMGIEYNPDMVTLSNENAAKAGVADRVKFVKADIYEADFSQASVITMYLLPSINVKLRPKLLDMKPGTRITSHAFDMGDWAADETATVDGRNAYLWIVPAKSAGTWRLQMGNTSADLVIVQTYQKLEGSMKRTDRILPVQGSVRGDEIRISYPNGQGGRRELVGKVSGDRMEGQSGTERWSANRVAKPAG